jgi:hypothetical protein
MYYVPQTRELLEKRLESSKADAALIDQKLKALKDKDVPMGTLIALRSIARMYRDNIFTLRQAIRNMRSSGQMGTLVEDQ